MRRLSSGERGLVVLTLALAGGLGAMGCGGRADNGDYADPRNVADSGTRDVARRPDAAGGDNEGDPIGDSITTDAAQMEGGDAQGLEGSAGGAGVDRVDGAAGGWSDGGFAGQNGGAGGGGAAHDGAAGGIDLDGGFDGELPDGSNVDGSVAVPRASFSSTAIDFGTGDCGASAGPQTLEIQNTGNAPLTVGLLVTGATFAVSPSTSQSIAAGESRVFTLSAAVPSTATAGSTMTGALKVTTNDSTHTTTDIALSVVPRGGTLAWGVGSPTNADFGIAPQNAPDNEISLTLQNTGNAAVGVTLGSASNGQFSILAPTKAETVAAGGTLPIRVGFTPSSFETTTATTSIAVTGAVCGKSVTSLGLSGRGGTGKVTGWPTTGLDFGLVPCGGPAPQPQTFTLHNSGNVAAKITSATLSGSIGYTTDAAGTTIPVNGDVTIQVTAPAIPQVSAVPGNYNDTLTIRTNVVGDSPHAITLTERAHGAVLAWDTSATDRFGSFGLVPVGTTATQSYQVVNKGNAASDVMVTAQAPFSVGNGKVKVGGGSSEQASLSFTPLGYSGASSTLTMAGTNLCQPPPAPLNIAGTGQAGGIALSTQSLSFSANCGTTAAPRSFTIANTGNAPMTFKAALAANSPFATAPASHTLAAGEETTVTVTSKPLPIDRTVLTDVIAITTDIPGDTVHTVSLTETPLGDVVRVDPLSISFGEVPVVAGTASASRTLTFDLVNDANQGSAPAVVNLMSGDSTHFSVETPWVTMGPGQRQTVHATFTPGTGGAADAVIRESSIFLGLDAADARCAADPPSKIPVSGTGTLAQVSVSTHLLEFGLVNCGATAAPQQIVLTNTGNQTYKVTQVELDNKTYYSLAMSPEHGTVAVGESVTITVTPNTIPSVVNTVPALSTFSGTVVVHTDAQFESPEGRSVALVMGAKGAIIDNNLASAVWDFGSVRHGATGMYNLGIRNRGNATAQVSLDHSNPVFGLAFNPTTVAASDGSVRVSTTLSGTFTPNQPSGTWQDLGTLEVTPTTGQVFCAPLPQSWDLPTITLAGTASSAPVITLSGPVTFSNTYCDAVPPPARDVTITNMGNTTAEYTASLDVGNYYAITPTAGSVAPNSTSMIRVTPNLPPTGVNFPGTGATPYDERLRVVIGGEIYVVPVSMTVTGAVLSASMTDATWYPNASRLFGPQITISNVGNLAASVTPVFARDLGFYLNPNGGAVAGGTTLTTSLRYNGSSCGVSDILSFSATTPHVCQNSTVDTPLLVTGCQ